MDNRYPTTAFNNDDIAQKLDTPVFQEVISKRSGRGNTTLSYLRGDIIADQLNAIFGPLGWDLRAGVPVLDHWEGDKETGGYNNQEKKIVSMHTVQVMTQMTLRIKARSAEDSDTIFTQTGIGYGEIEATKNRKEVVGMALKGAETDGLKRCASLLGRAMGMFLTGTGSQDEIDYAHNGKNADITKGKRMRQDRLSSSGNTSETRLLEDRSQERQPSGGNRSGGNARQIEDRQSDRQNDRQHDRRDDRRQDDRPSASNRNGGNARQADDRPDKDNGSARQDDRRQDDNRGDSVESSRERQAPRSNNNDGQRQERSESKPAQASAKGGEKTPESGRTQQSSTAGKEKAKAGFDLERLPVTGDDQVEFSKEILARLDEFNQVSDKEKFLKTHYNTIKNLDSKYRRRLIERLGEQKIDFEALGAK